MTMQGTDWRADAACLDVDPELFFPVGNGAPARAQIVRAKQVCRSCPVAQRCAEMALANGYEGVWGGLDDSERRRARRGRLVTSCVQRSGGATAEGRAS